MNENPKHTIEISGRPPIRSSVDFFGTFMPWASVGQIAGEPRLVGCLGLNRAAEKGGPLTNTIIDALPADAWSCPPELFPVIDTRCQRLMPGQFGAIPGWHCDDWPRPSYDGQPNPLKVNHAARHYTGIIDTEGGSLAPTEYVRGDVSIVLWPEEPVWRQVHRRVEELGGEVRRVLHSPGAIARMDWQGIHRATPATKRGWRFWFRLSFAHRPPPPETKPGPEQVYVLSEESGW